MEKISKISQTNKIPKRQHKEKNSQSNNRYSEPKKKKENFKEILENEEKILEKTETQQNVKRAIDAYKIQMQISSPIIKRTQKKEEKNSVKKENFNIKQEENIRD